MTPPILRARLCRILLAPPSLITVDLCWTFHQLLNGGHNGVRRVYPSPRETLVKAIKRATTGSLHTPLSGRRRRPSRTIKRIRHA